MFKFSRSPAPPLDSVKDSAANSSQAMLDIQRELLLVAFKDTVRHTGVPRAWIGCEVHTRPGPAGTQPLEVHLIIQQWSGHLLRYAMAFQRQLLQCLDRYEPGVDHAGVQWLWRFAPDCQCPFPTMPDPQEWAQKLEARTSAQAPAPRAAATPATRQHTTVARTAPAPEPTEKPFDLRDVFADLEAP